MREDGSKCTLEQDIANIITDHFEKIFSSQLSISEDQWSDGLKFIPRLVSDEMNDQLNAPVSEEEIKLILFQMAPTKAPGLDGLSALFYQKFWDILKEDIVEEVLKGFRDGVIDSRLNETLIVLIPKVKKVERVEQLRPISLCNVAMKIMTKVLANRLKAVLPQIISHNQSAFVEGRMITDNILIAQEISHYIKGYSGRSEGYISLKLDMSKAFDRLEWMFLEKMMEAMGFDRRWIEKVMLCVRSVKYKVKINDKMSDLICPSRGLRQGDPLSHYLFIICADWLSHAIRFAQLQGDVKGIKICRSAPEITHLMFVDDCLLFTEARESCVSSLKESLNLYEKLSGQQINLEKSELCCSRKLNEERLNAIEICLQVRRVEMHSKYLGLPIIFGPRKKMMFNEIKEKVSKRIGDWKAKLLSGAGKEVLIKAIIQAIPQFAMSCFKIPVTLCKQIFSQVLKFWWPNKRNSRGVYWVRAEKLFEDKIDGGLGFRRWDLMNLALLARQMWRMIRHPDLLMSRVFEAKYFHTLDAVSAGMGSKPSFVSSLTLK